MSSIVTLRASRRTEMPRSEIPMVGLFISPQIAVAAAVAAARITPAAEASPPRRPTWRWSL
jgi:hypothetical protein